MSGRYCPLDTTVDLPGSDSSWSVHVRRTLTVCLALLSLLALPAVAGAQEQAGEVTVHGKGFGHGIGMSQYGARSMAAKGFTAEEIVRHYYTGVAVESRRTVSLRVGLTNAGAAWELHNDADSAEPLQVHLGTEEGPVAVPAGSSVAIAQRQDGTTCRVAVDPDEPDAPDPHEAACDDLEVRWPVDQQSPDTYVDAVAGGDPITLARGWIDFVQAGDAVHTVLRIGMEDYLYGLAEVPSSWPSEALQAQVLAGRTFALGRAANPRGAGCSCDLVTTIHDQHYAGWAKESEGSAGHYGASWVAAVDGTNSADRSTGQVITYGGALINAYYSSSSPGTTEDPRDIWNANGAAIPYLQPVNDEYAHDDHANNSLSSWTRTFDYHTISDRLDFDEVHAVELVGHLRSGNPGVYRVTGERNGQQVTEDLHTYRDLRGKLGLPSHGITRIDLELPGPFTDVTVAHRFHEAIAWADEQGIVAGYDDGTFRPTRDVTRQAAAAFLYRLAGEPDGHHTTDFTDVPTDHPFHDAIAWADQRGLVSGYDDGTFRPGREVTRQAMAAFLARYEFGEAVPDASTTDFSDVPTGHPFHDEIAWMSGRQIAEGYDDGTCRPGRAVARQAAAAFLHRYDGS